jgi:indolepyruvate ferredoxin oxidoreductase beta subunit
MDILLVGVGGQGIVLASDILCLAALYAGYDTKKSEIHGMSQRGGSVFSHVRFAKKVYSPVIAAGSANILASLEESETLRWLHYTNKNTTIIYVKARIPLGSSTLYPEGTEDFLKKQYRDRIAIDPECLCSPSGNPKTLNVSLVGTIAGLTGIDRKFFGQAIRELVPPGTQEINMSAFDKSIALTRR